MKETKSGSRFRGIVLSDGPVCWSLDQADDADADDAGGGSEAALSPLEE